MDDPPGQIVMLDGQRWSLMLVLLSMDLLEPFHEALGLELPEGFEPALREVILRHAKPDPKKPSMFVPDALETIAEIFGDDECEALVDWGRFVFAYDRSEHVDHWSWRAILEKLSENAAAWASLSLPQYLRKAAHERFLARAERDHEDQLHEQARSRLLSDWDACFHVLRAFESDPDDPGANDPARWVRDTTEIRRSREFWAWLLGQLNEPARAKIFEAARAHHDDDELRHPRVLVRSHGR